MLFRKISLIILILACSKTLWPCSCERWGTFLDMAKSSELVVRAKVLKYSILDIDNNEYKTMDIEIMEIYKGQEIKKTIRVLGGDGATCRPSVYQFVIGNTYIIAFYRVKEGDEQNDYFSSICGEYSLKVKKQIVIGHITNKSLKMKRQSMKLAFFNGFLRGVLNR